VTLWSGGKTLEEATRVQQHNGRREGNEREIELQIETETL
jgi:hypothetical protein